MKKLALVAAIMATAAAMADVKIGTVDMMKLVRNHSSYESNRKYLIETKKDFTKALDAMGAELDKIQADGAKLANEYRTPMISDARKKEIENAVADAQSRFLDLQQKMRAKAMENERQLAEMEGRFIKMQTDDVKAHIKKFAEKNGYDFIISDVTTMYAAKAADVTDGVLKEMGVDPKKAKSVDDGSEKSDEGK